MRICILSSGTKTDSIPPLYGGGIQAYIWGLSNYLTCKGHNIHIFARRQPSQISFEEINGIHIHRIDTRHAFDFVTTSAYGIRAAIEVRHTEKKKGRFDVYHAHSRVITAILALEGFKPLIFSEHNWDVLVAPRGWVSGFPLYDAALIAERIAIKGASITLAISEGVKDAILRRIKVPDSSIIVIPNAVDLETFKINNRSYLDSTDLLFNSKDVILFVGRLAREKGVEKMISVMKRIVKVKPNVLLVVVGDGPLSGSLKRLSQELCLQDNVFFTGKVCIKRLIQIYAESKLLVLPSYFEVMPTVVLEAMAMEKPVVASNIPGNDEVVVHGETGYLIDLTNEEELANAVIKILNDTELPHIMGKKGRRRVQELFSYESVGRKMEETYLRAKQLFIEQNIKR